MPNLFFYTIANISTVPYTSLNIQRKRSLGKNYHNKNQEIHLFDLHLVIVHSTHFNLKYTPLYISSTR